jgi:hypothetical protein
VRGVEVEVVGRRTTIRDPTQWSDPSAADSSDDPFRTGR